MTAQQLAKMQAAARKARARRAREALADAIRDTRRTYPHCECGLRAGMTRDDLRALGAGCCELWVCPRLDAIRRRLGL